MIDLNMGWFNTFFFPLLFKALQTLDGLILKAASLVVPFLNSRLEPCPIGDRSHRRTVTSETTE